MKNQKPIIAALGALSMALSGCTSEVEKSDTTIVTRVVDSTTTSASPGASSAPAAGSPSLQWAISAKSAGPISVGMSADSALVLLGHKPSAKKYDACEYLADTTAPIHIMLVDGRVARFDVRDSTVRTGEGAGIGDSISRIQRLYPGRVRIEPHKYTDGHYLVVTPVADTMYRIIFETDRTRVTTYRAGRLPAVGYVEGCS